MSSLHFPIDVVEDIIDVLAAHSDHTALARCIWVCKSWLPRSRYRLWHRLIISRGDQLPAICNTLKHDTFLRSTVQIVRLEVAPGSDVDAPGTPPIAAITVLLPYLGHIIAWEFYGCLVTRLVWSRDGSQIFVQDSTAKVHIYDALTFTHLRTLSPPPIYTETFGVQVRRASTLALSEDEQYLLSDVALAPFTSSSIKHSSICVWTLATGSCELHFLRYYDNAVPGIDSKIYATTLRQHSSPQCEDPDRPHVVAICENGTLLTAAVGLPDAVTTIRPPGDLRPIHGASFSSEGTRVLVVGGVFCLVLDTLTGATIAGIDSGRYDTLFRGIPTSAKLSGDGRVAMIQNERSQRWFGLQPEWWLRKVEDGTLHQVLSCEDGPAVWKCALSRDGCVAGFATEEGEVFFRNVGDLDLSDSVSVM
ncbi:uncharacterized protein BXZ73DRAFT_100291 [Epithele typhae]|uniref:uncharacterized protein n=1 Tax=Epithele typhae TaxID=378194 RepID=UPI002007EEEC|nr:uncharacterized protein BXZ73DRAFT_100291 [Epithele typhae]KAH9936876.1 hypothetical protein BXZ73DRAFT_100291 [Epithele typhae]